MNRKITFGQFGALVLAILAIAAAGGGYTFNPLLYVLKTSGTATNLTAINGFQSFPSNYTTSVSIGTNAALTGSAGIAVGQNTTADTLAVALGAQSTASASSAVAVGYLASATAIRSIAIGRSATATNQYATAIGYLATATNDYSVALGYQATTTTNNQIRVGTTNETTSIPGAFEAEGKITTSRTTLSYVGNTNVQVNCNLGNDFVLTVTTNTFLLFTNIPPITRGYTANVQIKQGGTFTVTTPATNCIGTNLNFSAVSNAVTMLSVVNSAFTNNQVIGTAFISQ